MIALFLRKRKDRARFSGTEEKFSWCFCNFVQALFARQVLWENCANGVATLPLQIAIYDPGQILLAHSCTRLAPQESCQTFMILSDLHMHSTYSLDGNNTIADLCEQALRLGLTHIAVTDHVEWPPNSAHQRPDYDRYFAELRQCQARFAPRGLTLLSGLELGNPHEHRADVDALLASYDFDVVIGSLHWLAGQNIHDTRCFNEQDPYEVYTRYFGQLAQIAATVDCHIIAHFDRIFWPGTSRFGPPQIERIETPVREAMRALAEHGRVLELNTRFLTHEPGWNDALLTVLRWYRAEGGQFVAINSDTHRAAELGRHRAIGQALVEAAGCAPYVWQATPTLA
jgi:histidinol-phosphatase (PHP family)